METYQEEDNAESGDRRSLFHYTTAAGLLGIVTTSSLWATDVRFLNDAQEMTYAHQLLADAVQGMRSPTLDPSHFAYERGDGATEAFAQYQQFVVDELKSTSFSVYVACFCESGDLLSQWRAYGSDHGYAIEVGVDTLRSALSGLRTYSPATGLSRVRYGDEGASQVIPQALAAVARFNLNHPGVKAHYTALELTSMLATIKHPGFREEREWRVCAAFEDFAGRGDMSVPFKFRATPMAIAPYVELPLAPDAILTVRVGPGIYADVREAGVRRLLRTYNSNASVVCSDVPLRA